MLMTVLPGACCQDSQKDWKRERTELFGDLERPLSHWLNLHLASVVHGALFGRCSDMSRRRTDERDRCRSAEETRAGAVTRLRADTEAPGQ